jgi:serine/threonine protein kinase
MQRTEKQDIYTRITNQIVSHLEKGVRPWVRPWNAEHAAGRITRPLRHNGKPYSGINVLSLWASAMAQNFAAPIWMTFNPLGAGGMGEVYRARDTRLDRTVAIKILPAHLSDNPDAKERFDREARAISSLSHPNICTLHDVGHQDGIDYLVLEYLEGDTLADRLRKGPLSLEQVVKTGAEICEGLEKAHRKGVAHRDLKPSNIMLTKTGAKLMDFGLAKPTVAAIGAGSSSASLATMSKPLTVEGTILGTFQYMSPEQVEGKEADVRSDIFSLGAVLYEMITGKRAFEGKTTASTIAAILAAEPKPISTIQPLSPSVLEHVVKDCLEKDPNDRIRQMANLGGWWHGTDVEPQRARAVLPQRSEDDGCGDRHEASFRRR